MLFVIYDGTTYNRFDSITVDTSLDSLAGTFEIKTTIKESDAHPFGIGSFIVIKNEYDIILLSGFIEKMSGSITKDTGVVTYSGRDLFGDLIDSSVPASVASMRGSFTLEAMCTRVLDALGIDSTVINLAGEIAPFSTSDITAQGFAGKAGKFLQSFARKRQLFLTTDGNKNLVIFSPPSDPYYTRKLSRNSMLSRSFSFSTVSRFNKIEVGSEDNFATSGLSDMPGSVNRKSEFVDEEIRSTRYLQIHAEESMSSAELEGKAKEEVDLRRTRGFEYKCTVPSHFYVKGKLIRIEDSLADVNGVFLIRQVRYSSNTMNTCELTLCFPESYSALGVRTTRRKSGMGVQTVRNEAASSAPTGSWSILDVYPEWYIAATT